MELGGKIMNYKCRKLESNVDVREGSVISPYPKQDNQDEKTIGEHVITNEENTKVFVAHFCKVFNSPDLPPCNETALPSAPICPNLPQVYPSWGPPMWRRYTML
eukprot:10160077-Ditylum_brightwellii.AAC.1